MLGSVEGSITSRLRYVFDDLGQLCMGCRTVTTGVLSSLALP